MKILMTYKEVMLVTGDILAMKHKQYNVPMNEFDLYFKSIGVEDCLGGIVHN